MALPVAFCIFLYNLKSGFKAYDDLSELDRELDLENGDDNVDGRYLKKNNGDFHLKIPILV